MNKPLMTACAAFAALAATPHAAETELRPYAGLDLTRVSVDYKNIGVGVNGEDMFDDTVNGINPYVGLQFNKYVGAEIGYLQTEDGKKNVSGITLSGIPVESTKVQLSGFSADVVGRLPVAADEKLALLGSAGIGSYKADIKVNTAAGSLSDSDRDTALRFGVGAQYQLTDAVGARAMIRYIGAEFGDTTDHLVTASVGLNYRF